ncbi:MAG TPA: hypothetical protein VFW40_06060 [Capsulimonadaceae bacterium]|nr:hypothetical protein [Capsulimonadaceae bacterium]
MANSFLQYWAKDRCDRLPPHDDAINLTLMFGGPHQSHPGYKRFGVREGDMIHIVRVLKGDLWVIGYMLVSRVLPIEEYINENNHLFAGFESSYSAEVTFGNWAKTEPVIYYLAPTCTNEAAYGRGKIGFVIPVPAEITQSITFKNGRGIKHIVDGKIKNTVSLTGATYRLSDESAPKFADLLERQR